VGAAVYGSETFRRHKRLPAWMWAAPGRSWWLKTSDRAWEMAVWAGALLAMALTMAVAPTLDGASAVRRSGLSTPGAVAAQLNDQVSAVLAARAAADPAAEDRAWTDLLQSARLAEATLDDFGPNGRPLSDRVRRQAGPVRAAVEYVRSGASLRDDDPAQATAHLRRASQLLDPLSPAD
jgi:hypothetical protein